MWVEGDMIASLPADEDEAAAAVALEAASNASADPWNGEWVVEAVDDDALADSSSDEEGAEEDAQRPSKSGGTDRIAGVDASTSGAWRAVPSAARTHG